MKTLRHNDQEFVRLKRHIDFINDYFENNKISIDDGLDIMVNIVGVVLVAISPNKESLDRNIEMIAGVIHRRYLADKN